MKSALYYLLANEVYQHRFGTPGGYQSIGDVLREGGLVLLLGMLTVFAVLSLLWGVLELFRLFFHELPKRRKQKETAQKPEATVSTPVQIEESAPRNDEEIAAVIAAAIAAAKQDTPNGQFRVVSFKKR